MSPVPTVIPTVLAESTLICPIIVTAVLKLPTIDVAVSSCDEESGGKCLENRNGVHVDRGL